MSKKLCSAGFAVLVFLPELGAASESSSIDTLIQPEMADFNGDGFVSKAESREMELLIEGLPADSPLLRDLLVAYGVALSSGSTKPVDL